MADVAAGPKTVCDAANVFVFGTERAAGFSVFICSSLNYKVQILTKIVQCNKYQCCKVVSVLVCLF